MYNFLLMLVHFKMLQIDPESLNVLQSLYSSLGLWILTLVMTITYQGFLAGNFSTIVRHTAAWILGGHILLLVFLPIQVRCIPPHWDRVVQGLGNALWV